MYDPCDDMPTMGTLKTDSGIVRSHRLAAKRQVREEKLSKSENHPSKKRIRVIGIKGNTSPDYGIRKTVSPKSLRSSADGETRKKVVLASLHNLGNTCFMNSVLQVLYHTPEFCKNIHVLGSEVKSTMLALDILKQLNYEGLQLNDHLEWALVSRLDELLKKMKQIDNDILNGKVVPFAALRPYDLLDAIEEINSDFEGNQPQDAHELLKCLLMVIDETTNKLNRSRSEVKRCIGEISPIVIFSPNGKSSPSPVMECCVSLLSNVGADDSQRRTDPCCGYRGKRSPSLDGSAVVTSTNTEPDLKVVKGRDLSLDSNSSSRHFESRVGFNSPTSSRRSRSTGKFWKADGEISFKLETPSIVINQIRTTVRNSSSFDVPQTPHDARVSLSRLDSPRGLRRANIGTSLVANMATELFQGYMSLKTKCLRCGTESVRREEFQEISLPIRKEIVTSTSDVGDGTDAESDRVDLLELILSILNEVEQLDCDNLYFCSNCCHLVKAERRLSYELLPNILTIHLKRFASSLAGNFTKTSDGVVIPLELPCLETSCRDKKTACHRYLLYGIVSHTGKSLLSGHYQAYIRVPPPSRSPTLHPDDITSSQTNDGISLESSQSSSSPSPCQNGGIPESSDFSRASKRRSSERGTGADTTKESLQTAWYQCNDDVVTALNAQQLTNLLRSSGSNTPYMLFYHKVALTTENLAVWNGHR